MADCRFGLTLTNRGIITGASTLDDMLAITRQADGDEVWDSVWVGDSILAKPRLDAIALLGALAVQTERIRMGPACFASTPLRPALQLAYQWFSLDFISRGRTIFVACQGEGEEGGGRFFHEFKALGIEPGSRMRRMEEAIEIMRLTSSAEEVSYHGEYNQFEEVTLEPRPVQQPIPIWVTANPQPHHVKFRERSFRRVARLGDGWMVTMFTPAVMAEYLDQIRSYAREESGKDLAPDFEVAVYYNINVNEDRETALQEAKRFLDAYYTTDYSREVLDVWAALGSPERCIEEIRGFIDAGATTINLRLAGYDQQHQYRRVTEEVLPAFFGG